MKRAGKYIMFFIASILGMGAVRLTDWRIREGIDERAFGAFGKEIGDLAVKPQQAIEAPYLYGRCLVLYTICTGRELTTCYPTPYHWINLDLPYELKAISKTDVGTVIIIEPVKVNPRSWTRTGVSAFSSQGDTYDTNYRLTIIDKKENLIVGTPIIKGSVGDDGQNGHEPDHETIEYLMALPRHNDAMGPPPAQARYNLWQLAMINWGAVGFLLPLFLVIMAETYHGVLKTKTSSKKRSK